MSELPPNAIEQEPEHIPSLEEVQGVFEQLLGSEAYVEERRREDEKGLYLLDIVVKGVDGTTEYSYMRQGRYPEGGSKDTVVNITFYDGDGMPVSGSSVAKCVNGNWNLTP